MQGAIWSETARTTTQFSEMVMPRMLAMAERAWHKADWESLDDPEEGIEEDWYSFANTLGYKELKRLDALNVPYTVPQPGGR